MEREEKQNNQSMIVIALLCAALFGIAVAYAALSATLNLTFNKLTQEAQTWNVGFESGTVTATATSGGTNTVTCGEATVTTNTATIGNTILTTLHDKCVYALKIKNTGTIAATLETISAKVPTSMSCNTATTSQMVCGNTTYKLTTDAAGTSLLGTNNTLAASTGVLNVYLTVEYTGTQSGGSNVDQENGGFTIGYVQK